MDKEYRAIVIHSDTLIDGLGNAPIKDAEIYIENGKISRISPWNEGGQWPGGDDVLRLKSKAVMPGLINIHVHLSEESDLIEDIKHGVTSVRDVGTGEWDNSQVPIFDIKDQVDRGERIGPRIFSYGFAIDGPRTVFKQLTVTVSNEAEAVAEVDRQVAMGVNGIKLYFKLTPNLAKAILARAKEHGMPTAGHIGILIGGVEGARMGIDSIEHLVSFIRDFFPKKMGPMINLMERLGVMDNPSKGLGNFFKMWIKVDPGNKMFTRIAEDFARTGSVWHPTVTALEVMTKIGLLFGQRDPRFEKRMSIDVFKELGTKMKPSRWSDKLTRLGEKGLEGMLRFVKLMYDAGVPIGLGTDDSLPFVYPGISMQNEIALFARAGIAPVEIIRMATSQNAKTLRRDDLGVLSEGKTADVVLLGSDPLEDVSGVKDIECVIKDGKVVHSVIESSVS